MNKLIIFAIALYIRNIFNMSKYQFSIHNYHAINKATISLDGITVISGANGSGKSTLSKWLYYLINGANNYDKMLEESSIDLLRRKVQRYNIVRMDISQFRDADKEISMFFKEAEIKLEASDNFFEASNIYAMVLKKFCSMFTDYLEKNYNARKTDRALSYLNIHFDDTLTAEKNIERFYQHEQVTLGNMEDNLLHLQSMRPFTDFDRLLHTYYGIEDSFPNNIQFTEDNVKLIVKGKIGNLFNLNRAIYIDTPMAVSDESDNNIFWEQLHELMLFSKNNASSAGTGEKRLLKRIKNLINGEVKIRKDSFNGDELHYVREDGLDIRLEHVATGYKSFSYLQRLLENGHLDTNTLLLIDEPEAHLHPQWIVEFARLLVLINKEIGVKIMVASHNPDFVAAIQAIANKEGVAGTLNFYLARQSETGFTHDYIPLGQDIEEIFKSFNIAYQRIEQYGNGYGI